MNCRDLRLLHQEICVCSLCPLWESRTLAVPGSGPSPARIMLVGEAPGREEDLQGLPFVGRAGRLLDEALRQAGLERERIFITSVIKCRPPKNRKPKKAEIERCRPYLQAQMEILHPENHLPDGKHGIAGHLGQAGRGILARPDPAGSLSCHLSSRRRPEKQKSHGPVRLRSQEGRRERRKPLDFRAIIERLNSQKRRDIIH